MSARNYTARATATTVPGALTSGATSITVGATANLPVAPFTAVIERGMPTEEVVLVTAVAGLVLTCTRGYDTTTANAHPAGASFEHCVSAIDYAEANAHINATTGVHGATGALVDTGSAQSITGQKTMTASMLLQQGAGLAATIAQGPSAANRAYHDLNDTSGTLLWRFGKTSATLGDFILYDGTINLLQITRSPTPGIGLVRGTKFDLDVAGATGYMVAEAVAGTTFTDSTVGDMCFREANGATMRLGTNGAGAAQASTLKIFGDHIDTLDAYVAGRSISRGFMSGGFAQITADFATTSASATVVDVTGLAITVTAAANRRLKVTAKVGSRSTVAGDRIGYYIREGTTTLDSYNAVVGSATSTAEYQIIEAIITPTAGAHTYKVGFARLGGTGTVTFAATGFNAWVMAEDIGPAT